MAKRIKDEEPARPTLHEHPLHGMPVPPFRQVFLGRGPDGLWHPRDYGNATRVARYDGFGRAVSRWLCDCPETDGFDEDEIARAHWSLRDEQDPDLALELCTYWKARAARRRRHS